MFNPQIFFEAGRQRSGTALIPLFDTVNMILSISTRNGNTVINKGDGSADVNYTPPKNNDFTTSNAVLNYSYASAFTGNISIKFLQGLKDVYSIKLGHDLKPAQTEKYSIPDIGVFLRQFPNLYSLMMDEYSSYANNYSNINGDLADMPHSVERVFLRNNFVVNQNSFYLNFSTFTSLHKLKYFKGAIRFLGDLAKLPISCTYFEGTDRGGSSITYTAGKVWAHNLETFYTTLPLTTSELDNLLIDMQNSVTSVGAGTIELGGYRSSVSDAAVAYLQGLGRTVNVSTNKINANNFTDSALLRLDFQNNFDVYSNSGINLSDGNNYANRPTFALSGRKAGEYCAVFNGSQSIKTTTNLPVNSDKVTVAFWMKTTQTVGSVVTELSADSNVNNAFCAINNNNAANRIDIINNNTGFNSVRLGITHGGTWIHVAFVIDRSESSVNEIKLYINGVVASVTKPLSADNSGNFVNNILFIGQRAGNSLGFNGSLTRLKIYNYPFTPSEVSTLYNSEL